MSPAMKPLPCKLCNQVPGFHAGFATGSRVTCLDMVCPLAGTPFWPADWNKIMERPIPESGMRALEFLLEPGNWPEEHEHTLEPWKNVEYAMKKYSTPAQSAKGETE